MAGLEERIEEDVIRYREIMRAGGEPLTVGVARSIRLGGIVGDVAGEIAHEPFVRIGNSGAESIEDFSYFESREALEGFIATLRAAADEAWPTD